MDAKSVSVLIAALTPVVAPLLVMLIKKVQVYIPGWALPIIAILIGFGVDWLNQLVTGYGVGSLAGAVLGGAGVAVREIINELKQNYRGEGKYA